MKDLFVLLFGINVFTQLIFSQTAVSPAAGDGSKENPYQIATLENLYWITFDASHWQYYFVQTADINASATSNWFDGQGWLPIGSDIGFNGTYDGAGHSIDSVFINRVAFSVGLFGNAGGTITNLGVTHVNISGNHHVGGLIGYLNPKGRVKNCFSSGFINGGNINQSVGAGGLVGISASGFIENSYSSVTVNGHFGFSGGLLGSSSTGIVVNCYALGSVNGNGGLVGENWQSVILNSYSTGRVVETGRVGGLTGLDTVGYIFNSFWDIDSSGQTISAGGKGKSTTELKNPFLYTNACWDSSIWYIDAGVNNGYPYLSWQNPHGTPLPEGRIVHPATGDGTIEKPYQIATLENLYWLASNPVMWSQYNYYIQVADINASKTKQYSDGEGWGPIGSVGGVLKFYSTYNGHGHTIDSLYINRPGHSYVGLFGYITTSEIESLGVTQCDITGKNYVGGISGISSVSSIKDCFTTGKITGAGNYIGGLVGYDITSITSKVSNSYSRASIYGVVNVGGLLGATFLSNIERCFSTGIVTGTASTGGLIGSNQSSRVAFSFWNTVSSNQYTSAGGAGKTKIEMNNPSMFSESGWSSAVWFMDSTFNDGYPYFIWQNPNGTPLPLIPGFHASVNTIDFGSILLNSSKQDSVLISNQGTDTLKLVGISTTNSRFTFTMSTMNIPPSGSAYLYLICTLQDTSKQTGFIILTSNGLHSPDTITVSGRGSLLTFVDDIPERPTSYSIDQNYPNPFNPTTRIDYDIPQTSFVLLKIYDILGREVTELVHEVKQLGRYSVQCDGMDLPSGIYFYSINAGEFHQVKKMVLMK